MSLLDYARNNGLTLDHDVDNTDDIEFYVPPHGDLDLALEGPEGAQPLPVLTKIEPERLTLDADARALLASVLSLSWHHDYHDHDECATPGKQLKMDMPLLLTDPEVDMLSCKRKQPTISFGKVCFDLIEVDDEADEGLAWPQAYTRLPAEYEGASASERLTMARGDAVWLRDQLSIEDHHAEPVDVTQDQLKRRKALEPLTPPLSPVSLVSEEGHLRSSPLAASLAPLSDGTSPAVHLQKSVDRQLLEADTMTSHDCGSVNGSDGLADLLSPNTREQGPWSSSPFRFRAAKHKLEEPLTSPTRPIEQGKSLDEQPEMITQHLPEDWATLPPASEADFDELFRDTFAQGATHVERRLASEKIGDQDWKLYLSLPEAAESELVAPWHREDSASQLQAECMALLSALKAVRWHKLSTGFERELVWNPLPAIDLQDAFSETIEYDGVIEEFVGCLDVDAAVDHETLTWKPEGLRFLDEHDSDEDELVPVTHEKDDQPITMPGVVPVQKRKLPTEEPQARPGSADATWSTRRRLNLTASITRKEDRNITAIFPDCQHTAPFCKKPFAKPAVSTALKPAFLTNHPAADRGVPDLFTASNDLGSFIGLQTGQLPIPKKRKLDNVLQPKFNPNTSAPPAFSSASIRPPAAAPEPHSTMAVAPAQASDTTPHDQPTSDAALELVLPLPDIAVQHPIIISSTLLTTHRPLIHQLNHLHPNLHLIERDFAGLEKSGFVSPQARSSTAQVHQTSSIDSAPDVLISPSTAIVISTLQKVKQKCLPGHGHVHGHNPAPSLKPRQDTGTEPLNPLQNRILTVAQTTEKVIVLVTLPTPTSTITTTTPAAGNDDTTAAAATSLLDSRDTAALASFTSWATSLQTASSSPNGLGLNIDILTTTEDPAQIAGWVLALLAIAVKDVDIDAPDRAYDIIQDETTWEIFLRRAGMNAFGAQAILAALKAPDDSGDVCVVNGGGSCASTSKDSGGREKEKNKKREITLHGLPAFVTMPHSERTRRFSGLLGGRRVLDKVGRILDGPFRRV